MPKYTDLLAQTILQRYPSADAYPYKPWSYPQGFMLWGFIRLYESTRKPEYLDYILTWCDTHVGPDGDGDGAGDATESAAAASSSSSSSSFTGESLDDMMPGSVLVWAYAQTKREKYRVACEKIRRSFDDYPRIPHHDGRGDGHGGFWHRRDLPYQMWIDGLFMGLMFLVRYGAYIGDREYCFEEAVRQLTIAFDRCEKDGSGLLYHAYYHHHCEDHSQSTSAPSWAHPITGKSPEVWSEGLGWYAMILPEVLEFLPKTHPGYARLSMQLEKLITGLLKVQDPCSGLWYQVVDKPDHSRNWHDTSGSAMFVYCIKKAGMLGLYDRAICENAARRAFEGIKTKCVVGFDGNANILDACNGLGVQDNYDAYVGFSRNVNCQEAVAAFLWAAEIMEHGVAAGSRVGDLQA